MRRSQDLLSALKPLPTHLSEERSTDKVFVGNLPFTVTETAIQHIVSSRLGEGKVREIKIAKGKKTKRPLGFLFVDFVDFESASAAVNIFDGYDLEGRVLNANLKYPDDTSLIKATKSSSDKIKAAPLSSLSLTKTIYLSNLDYSLAEEEIYNMCDDLVGIGLVKEVRIPLDIETGSSRGFAYIEFKKAASVDIAIKELSDLEVYGRLLKAERMTMPKKKVVEVVQTVEEEEDDIFALLSY